MKILAAPVANFLDSLGVCTHVAQGGLVGGYVRPLNYLGVRNVRDADGGAPAYIALHRQTGARFDILCSADGDIGSLVSTASVLASAGALLSVEGPNEANNFPVTYGGNTSTPTDWLPVAQCQAALYAAMKSAPALAAYPVLNASEVGAQGSNCGLQFLTVPPGAGTLMPDGTQYADVATVHNYLYGGGGGQQYQDNMAWQAFEPVAPNGWDGMYGNYEMTWLNHYPGYSAANAVNVPRSATECGWNSLAETGGPGGNLWTQGVLISNAALDAFARGFSVFFYQLVDSEGGQGSDGWGLFDSSYNPKPAADFLHNLTTILADSAPLPWTTGALDYSIASMPATGHDLLLQKSNGDFYLVIWGESAAQVATGIMVAFGRRCRAVEIFDVTVGSEPVRCECSTDHVHLLLTDHAMVMRVAR